MGSFSISRSPWIGALACALACLVAPLARGAETPDDFFTIIALPDTQHYSEKSPDIYARQTQWIRDSVEELNIAFVAHLGDMVQNDVEAEWEVADRCMSVLDEVVPYCPTVGNHDMGGGREKFEQGIRDTRLFNGHFPVSRFDSRPWYGGHYSETNDNAYYLFSALGGDYLALTLEYGPRKDVVAWANRVIEAHPDRQAILITHFYLTGAGQRVGDTDRGSPTAVFPDAVSGEGLWQDLVSRHANFFLVLCGHISQARRLISEGANGAPVAQLLSDYQGMENGGDGYLRIMKFYPEKDAIEVKTYSPVRDAFLEDDDNQFELPWRAAVTVGTGAR